MFLVEYFMPVVVAVVVVVVVGGNVVVGVGIVVVVVVDVVVVVLVLRDSFVPTCNSNSLNDNKAGHTATPVACRWAGTMFEVTPSFGQEE